jgi:putative sigma-54 modulation protein
MLYNYKGRNREISQHLKSVTEKKLERLSKFFTPQTQVNVTFKEENRTETVEITIPIKGAVIRSEASSDNVYTCIDLVMEKLERRIIKNRDKLISKAKQDKSFKQEFFDSAENTADAEPAEKAGALITRTKTVEIKPMSKDEAILQMELLGHDFFVFKDEDTHQVAVVYCRKQPGTYGILEIED